MEHGFVMEDGFVSDAEPAAAPVSRFPGAGKRSLQSMLESAMEDRVESNKKVKAAVLTHKSPNVEYQCSLWKARLDTFRTAVLGVKE